MTSRVEAPARRQTTRPRARAFGLALPGTPGLHNAITDVPGVTVGHCTLIEGSAVRTGVTAVRPRGADAMPAFAGQFALNGNGELTGAAWIAESGLLDGPVLLTNTHSVGAVRDGYVRWLVDNGREPATNANRSGGFWALPVVGETFDGILNDINGFHVTHAHVAECIAACAPGAVREGSVGAGTGTISFGFKAGIGTASRIVRAPRRFSLGVLVQANCGRIEQLTICGVPVGRAFARTSANGARPVAELGSIMIVVATDAPLLPHQLNRLAKRAAMGLARTGSTAGNGSGDLIIAFSTAPVGSPKDLGREILPVAMLQNEWLNPLFDAVVEATEEAILNALFAAEAMTGRDGTRIDSLPLDKVRSVLARHRAIDA